MNETTSIAKRQSRIAITQETMESLSACSISAASAFASATTDSVNVGATLAVAEHIQDLRDLFDRPEVKARIEALQDTALGFRTDKDPKVWNKKLKNGAGDYNAPYAWPIVRDATIEATLRGLQLVGNQFNIISGRFYCTKEGFEYLIRKLPTISEFKMILDVPVMRNGGAIILCEGSWKTSGKDAALKVSIPVKSDEYSGADQILGKATRKFLHRCYVMMCGKSMPEGEAGDTDVAQMEAPTQNRFAPVKSARIVDATPVTATEAALAPVEGNEPAATIKEGLTVQPPADAPKSPQEKLADLVTGCGCSFDDLCQVLVEAGGSWPKIPDTCDGFAEMPIGITTKLVAAGKTLKAMLAAVKEVAA